MASFWTRIFALTFALGVATVSTLAQLVCGHQSADGVAENQSPKLAAFEGHYPENEPADLYLVGWVNKEKQEVRGIKVPEGLSFLVHWDAGKPVKGLNAFPEDERPGAVNAIFQFYHLMVAIGLLLIAITAYGTIQWWGGLRTPENSRCTFGIGHHRKGPYDESEIEGRLKLRDMAEQFDRQNA